MLILLLAWFYPFGLALPVLIVASFIWSDWSNIPWQGWAAVSYVGLFEMGITFLFWLKAMKTATNTALISNLIFISPFISLLLLSAIIGETIYVSTIVGLALIITGLLVQRLHFKKSLSHSLFDNFIGSFFVFLVRRRAVINTIFTGRRASSVNSGKWSEPNPGKRVIETSAKW